MAYQSDCAFHFICLMIACLSLIVRANDCVAGDKGIAAPTHRDGVLRTTPQPPNG